MHRIPQVGRTTRLIPGILLASVIGLAGCGSSQASVASTASTTAADESAPAGTAVGADEEGAPLLEHHRHHHGGVAMFLSMSLDSLGLSESERASVEKVQGNLTSRLEPLHAAEGGVFQALADGVAAGNVDKGKVDQAIAQLDATLPAVRAATNDALNQLHSILTPPERQALVQKLEAHWQVWQEANRPPEASGGAASAHGDHAAAFARELGLTPAQTDQLRQATTQSSSPDTLKKLDPAEAEQHLRAFGAAFVGNTFDAGTLNGGDGITLSLPSHGVRRLARLYEAAAPLLTPDQRATASARLREHASREAGK